MINKPLSKVKNGDVFDLSLANNLIQRIEYAAELLKGGNFLAGDNISIKKTPFGTEISSRQIYGFTFDGFLSVGKYPYLIYYDLDNCTFGPNPPPDGISYFEAIGSNNLARCYQVSGKNMEEIFPVGTTINLTLLINTFKVVISDNIKYFNASDPGCGNPTGELVRLELKYTKF